MAASNRSGIKPKSTLEVQASSLSEMFCNWKAYDAIASVINLPGNVAIKKIELSCRMRKKVEKIKINRGTFFSFQLRYDLVGGVSCPITKNVRLKMGFLTHCRMNAIK